MKRRSVLATGAATGLGVLAAPAILRAQSAPLRVGTYGGALSDKREPAKNAPP